MSLYYCEECGETIDSDVVHPMSYHGTLVCEDCWWELSNVNPEQLET